MMQAAKFGTAALMLAGLLAGCSSGDVLNTSRLSSMFNSSGAYVPPSASDPRSPPPDFECPGVEIRPGAATLSISRPSRGDPDPNDLRYQITFGQMARECSVNAGTVSMRVGVSGRVVLGPAGSEGQIQAPLRFAVVREGPEPRTIVTTLHQVPITVPPGDGNVAFTTIAEDLTFPIPPGGEIDSYVVYVGFDPQGAQPSPARGRGRRAR